jgi:two-component system, chemotaxis family, CheB/CheR fusion protein
LFLGPSESLGELKKSFVEVDKKWKIFKSIEVVRNLRNTTYSTPGLDRQMGKLNLGSTPQKNIIKSNLSELTSQTLLEETGYEAGIWVNPDFEIIQTYGNYEKFLLPKIFNFNLLEMLPKELSIATSTTLRKALSKKSTYIIKDVVYQQNDKPRSVNVFVKPIISEEASSQNVVLVLFSEEKSIQEGEVEYFEMKTHTTQHLEDIKNELAETKQRLNDAYEALEVSNDNISSYNEELISGNEEMQSTNEELQSVNEELQTVNNEYQVKIKELAELNDDLNNYFKSTINAQLYVDRDLFLRKYTPSAIRQVNVKESDIGRPISDITTNIRFSTLMDDIQHVIESSDTFEKEVQTLDGRWYQMMAIPYVRQQDNRNDGVIITFNDITELKRMQDKLSRINADHDTFIYAVSHDLKGPLANLGSLISFLEDSVELESEEEKEIMSLINVSVANLSHIVTELSDITKIEKEIDVKENIDIKGLMKEVEFGMKDKIGKSGATINLNLNTSTIPFSKKNLRGIMTNLLSNALKYRSPDRAPEVTIRTETLPDFIVLSIQDNGLGIPESKKYEIFARFKRAHTHVEGNGVGLYLVKKIINNAGGDIEVESEVGKGSVFKVYFKK